MDLESLVERIESSDRRVKIEALKELQHYCNCTKTSAEILVIFNTIYLHILKCYSDRYESVRNEAVLTANLFIQRLPPNDFHFSNIISTLTERVGKTETIEESEEIRLVYVSQLSLIVQQSVVGANVQFLEESYSDVIEILVKCLRDTFPAAQREACACVKKLATDANTASFQKWAHQLLKPLYSILNHKHSQSRIAAVQALTRLSLHVSPSDNELAQLFMEVSPLLMDSMPLVRRECGLLGITMLLELKDRYSYFDRIIPLVLCCLKDDSRDVYDYIQPLWIKCGEQYYSENELELNKQALADLQIENYPQGVQRPYIGCRALVQRSLRLLKLITRESADWKGNVRLHSMMLLYQFVLHAESAMTSKFFEIYSDVARACSDTEKEIAREALKVADLMGRLFWYDDWYEHGFDGLLKTPKLSFLKCFYYMFAASSVAKSEDLVALSALLVKPDFSQNLKPEFQFYVVKLIQIIVQKFVSLRKTTDTEEKENILDVKTAESYKNLYMANIKVMALSLSLHQDNQVCQNIQQTGNDILQTIAQYRNVKLSELHEEYFVDALEYVTLDAHLDALSEPILLLEGLLRICKFRASYLDLLESKLNEVWQNCADDAKVRILSTVSIVMLSWHETITVQTAKSTELLQKFVETVIEPHLLWKAGANAEAMRSLATATLCAIAEGAQSEASEVLSSLAKLIPGLLEDQSVATRNYALKCLKNLGSLEVERLKPIAYAVLQRLDDPSANIRVLAATMIPKLKPQFDQDKNANSHEHRTWNQFIRKALELLFLHFEGPEGHLKEAIKDSLLKLSIQHSDDFKKYLERADAMAYDNSSLKELRKQLSFEYN